MPEKYVRRASFWNPQKLVCSVLLFAVPVWALIASWDWIQVILAIFSSAFAAVLLNLRGKNRAFLTLSLPFVWRLFVFYTIQIQICKVLGWSWESGASISMMPFFSSVDPVTMHDRPEDALKLKRQYIDAPSPLEIEVVEGIAKPGTLSDQENKLANIDSSLIGLPILEKTEATFSVVLPCANEGRYMVKTAESILEFTPQDVLEQIVVVDDGSSPPLKTLVDQEWEEKHKIHWIRHESHTGLINAKVQGGNSATGDIVVFLDCHVKPAPGWWKSIADKIKSNYRRVVVPTITNLDPDTWVETRPGGGMAKCYLTWDADFKWFVDESEYVPIMSGGLLAMSNQWWRETGGYDSEMEGWGGENIDQSLRIWLCGGEIVQATQSFVAHMWRVPDKPQTRAKYKVPGGAVTKNRFRAALAWFGDWIVKFESFPDFTKVFKMKDGMDVSRMKDLATSLKCRNFGWFLHRFKGIYEDAGLLPDEVFQLKEVSTGLCLESRWFKAADGQVKLSPCSSSNSQKWHRANRLPKAEGGGCCSGLRAWNTDQCLSVRPGQKEASSFVCSTFGDNPSHFLSLTAKGELKLKNSDVCLGGKRVEGPKLKVFDCSASEGKQKTFYIEKVSGDSIKLYDESRTLCLTAAGGAFEMLRCSTSASQEFSYKQLRDGHRIQAKSDRNCFDSGGEGGGGRDLLSYPCYSLRDENQNQIFYFEALSGDTLHLSEVPEGGIRILADQSRSQCLGFSKGSTDKEKVLLADCVLEDSVPKFGQRLSFEMKAKEGTPVDSTIEEEDGNSLSIGVIKFKGGRCAAVQLDEQVVASPCDLTAPNQEFVTEKVNDAWVIKSVSSGKCLDANNGLKQPIVFPCDPSKENQNQLWKFEGEALSNELYRKCLDFFVGESQPVSVVSCEEPQTFSWEKLNTFEPVETTLYRHWTREAERR